MNKKIKFLVVGLSTFVIGLALGNFAMSDVPSKELAAKKAAMDKNYATKLSAIDDSISKQIEAQAKAGGYDIVLAKGAVLYGGSDITEAVKKAVK